MAVAVAATAEGPLVLVGAAGTLTVAAVAEGCDRGGRGPAKGAAGGLRGRGLQCLQRLVLIEAAGWAV